MSNEYVAYYEDEEKRKVKQDFLDYIISIENNLEIAEEYGSLGDIRMFDVLKNMVYINEDVASHAKFAEEEMPPEDYGTHVWHLVRDCFQKVASREIERIQNGVDADGLNRDWKSEISNLIDQISFFKKVYVELDVEDFLNTLDGMLK